MDINNHNQKSWDGLVARGNQWTVPVSPEAIEKARKGDWRIVLTAEKPLPKEWLEPVAGKRILCLAGGGGQQAPILAAAGAEVTTFDLSPAQLEQDQVVAKREGLSIRTVQGDMRDLSALEDESFDAIVHPCSNCFCPELQPVWNECFRVLVKGGCLLSGIINPLVHIFDYDLMEKGELVVRHKIPYSDLELPQDELDKLLAEGEPMWFGHSLTDQIGGQLVAGFVIESLYEDRWKELKALSDRIALFVATLARKPK